MLIHLLNLVVKNNFNTYKFHRELITYIQKLDRSAHLLNSVTSSNHLVQHIAKKLKLIDWLEWKFFELGTILVETGNYSEVTRYLLNVSHELETKVKATELNCFEKVLNLAINYFREALEAREDPYYVDRVIVFEHLNWFLHDLKVLIVYMTVGSSVNGMEVESEVSRALANIIKHNTILNTSGLAIEIASRYLSNRVLLASAVIGDEFAEPIDAFEMDFLSEVSSLQKLSNLEVEDINRILVKAYSHGLSIARLYHLETLYRVLCSPVVHYVRNSIYNELTTIDNLLDYVLDTCCTAKSLVMYEVWTRLRNEVKVRTEQLMGKVSSNLDNRTHH